MNNILFTYHFIETILLMKLSKPVIKNRFNKLIVFLSLFVYVTLPVCAFEQSVSSKVKAAFVYNFIKYTEWPNEKSTVNFTLGYYGDDQEYYKEIQKMQGIKVKLYRLNIIKITSLEQLNKLQVVVIDKTRSKKIANIAKQLDEQATLIISDNAKDKKYSMLNFVKTNGKQGFELNRYRMLNAGLKVSPDILVLGGTELDIASVLKEMDAKITTSLDEIKKQSNILEQLKENVTSKEKQLRLQQTKFVLQQDRLALQKKSLTSQNEQLEKQDSELKQNKYDFQSLQNNYSQITKELDVSRTQLTSNIESLDSLKHDIQQKELSIDSLGIQINKRKKLLNNLEKQQAIQKQELSKQSSVIQTQNIFLIVIILVSFTILIVLIVIYKSRKALHKVNQALQTNITALDDANTKLSTTQEQLVESEKMAALGGLVAGVAHEINTPIGVSVTATTHLADQLNSFEKEYKAGQLKKSSLENLLIDAKESSGILTRNLQRASELINNFKQVAVDQSSEDKREFELHSYIEELIKSLAPQFRQGKHSVHLTASGEIPLNNFPGVIAQIITNLLINSLNHGFKNTTHGEIFIALAIKNNDVVIDYRDKGIGLSEQQREKVFEPFYTTARSIGGSGLGMSISYNLVTSKLNGTIHCLESSEGAHFQITFPQ